MINFAPIPLRWHFFTTSKFGKIVYLAYMLVFQNQWMLMKEKNKVTYKTVKKAHESQQKNYSVHKPRGIWKNKITNHNKHKAQYIYQVPQPT